jgi:hypothetical protein
MSCDPRSLQDGRDMVAMKDLGIYLQESREQREAIARVPDNDRKGRRTVAGLITKWHKHLDELRVSFTNNFFVSPSALTQILKAIEAHREEGPRIS